MPQKTIQSLLQLATQQLNAFSDSARFDVELLLCHCLNKPRSFLFTYPEKTVSNNQYQLFQQLLERRCTGEPLAYLIGYRDFWSLRLKVTKDTLIPRPETELLIETCLALLPNDKAISIVDLGTGSGAIALALASEYSKAKVLAVDISNKALAVAQENAANHAINNVEFLQSNWFSEIPHQQFDLIISNPPYIEAHDPHLQRGDVRYEPLLALQSGQTGFDDIEKIISQSSKYLKQEAWLMFEHGYQQAKQSRRLLRQAGFKQVHSRLDLAGHERITLGACPRI